MIQVIWRKCIIFLHKRRDQPKTLKWSIHIGKTRRREKLTIYAIKFYINDNNKHKRGWLSLINYFNNVALVRHWRWHTVFFFVVIKRIIDPDLNWWDERAIHLMVSNQNFNQIEKDLIDTLMAYLRLNKFFVWENQYLSIWNYNFLGNFIIAFLFSLAEIWNVFFLFIKSIFILN